MHLWLRAEQRPNEARTGLTPDGAAALIAAGHRITVEDSPHRCLPLADYVAAGCAVAPFASWPDAPADAVILGLKELPEDGTPLRHAHILFGHAYKQQHGAMDFLRRFRAGGGVLHDLESLVDDAGRRVAAFGYWAGYAGAAVAVLAWAAQRAGTIAGPLTGWPGREALLADLRARDIGAPRVIIIGALGRVGTGAADLCTALGLGVTRWDMAETAHGGPFPQVLAHEIFLNCILARPGCPVFVPRDSVAAPRALRVIGDIACDPSSDYSPVPVYDRVTDWAAPALRVADAPVLDVTAIDNLPSLLPVESSIDFAAQLLPHLMTFPGGAVWARARGEFERHAP